MLKLEIIILQSKEEEPHLTKNPYFSVDPAPPALESDPKILRNVLLDETQSLFLRYRAMFALRNKGDSESILALAEGTKLLLDFCELSPILIYCL